MLCRFLAIINVDLGESEYSQLSELNSVHLNVDFSAEADIFSHFLEILNSAPLNLKHTRDLIAHLCTQISFDLVYDRIEPNENRVKVYFKAIAR